MTEPADRMRSPSDQTWLSLAHEISSRASIGLIGAGLLGSAIAQRLMLAGRAVTGFDISEPCRTRLRELGGQVTDNSADVFRQCRIVFLSLPDGDVVQRLIDDTGNAIDRHLIIDTTTCAPETSRLLGSRLAECGTRYLDATVVGSSVQAQSGETVMLVGGEREAFELVLPLLQALSSKLFHTGTTGSGATAKLIVNLVLGLNRAVLAEGLSLARSCGVDLSQMLQILKCGAAYSRVMDTKGQKMLTGDFTPQARLDQHWKDVRLILELGRRHKAALPLSQVHDALLERASAMGFGASDNCAVIRAFDDNHETGAAGAFRNGADQNDSGMVVADS